MVEEEKAGSTPPNGTKNVMITSKHGEISQRHTYFKDKDGKESKKLDQRDCRYYLRHILVGSFSHC